MKITHCRINHIENPMGYALPQITASWITESDISTDQAWARIRVAADEQMKELLYDSGEANLNSTGTKLPMEVNAYGRYFWTVAVRGNNGDEAVSEVQYFEMGKMDDPWTGQWITTPWTDQSIRPVIRKRFSVTSQSKKGRLYITGLGMYRVFLNGRPITNEIFAPGSNAVDCWLQVYTYDVTSLLLEGENEILVYLGDGWAKSQFGGFGNKNIPQVDDFSLRAELHIEDVVGVKSVIGTDESWEAAPSKILFDGIYDGEIVDFNQPESDFSFCRRFVPAVDTKKVGVLQDRLSLPIVIRQVLKPVEMLQTPAGEIVLDFGQNISGYVRFHLREKQGTKVEYFVGETLQNNNFYRDNLRTAKAQFTAISDGTNRVVEPMFTWYGFRYVKLVGFSNPKLEDFEACHVSSDLEETGFIETSDDKLNRLFLNSVWSQRDNFLDVPTDCPQRDERMGWTGDAQVFCRTASFHMDTYAFYTKWMRDLYEEQKLLGGMVGSVVPSYLPRRRENTFVYGGSSVWGDCAVILPWTIYRTYGDTAILENQFDSMCDWVDWIYEQEQKNSAVHLWDTGFHFGDWLALDGAKEGGVRGGTEETYIASIYYYNSVTLTAKTAKLLGRKEQQEKYETLADEILQAIREEYFTATGRCVLQTQTALILALQFHIVPDLHRARTAKALRDLVVKAGVQLKTGFVGTPFLCLVLAENGYAKLAYDLLFREEYPGWLYEINMGATTIWERWNSIMPDGSISGTGMNSLNHYSYGSISEWMYRVMAGIQLADDGDTDETGYRRFRIHPMPDGRVRCVKAQYRSAMGKIKSAWASSEEGLVEMEITVPFGAVCTVELEAVEGSLQGLTGLAVKDGVVSAELKAGTYRFSYQSTECLKPIYTLDDKLEDLLADDRSREVLEKTAPELLSAKEDIAPVHDIPFLDAMEDILSEHKQEILLAMEKAGTAAALAQVTKPYRDNGLRL